MKTILILCFSIIFCQVSLARDTCVPMFQKEEAQKSLFSDVALLKASKKLRFIKTGKSQRESLTAKNFKIVNKVRKKYLYKGYSALISKLNQACLDLESIHTRDFFNSARNLCQESCIAAVNDTRPKWRIKNKSAIEAQKKAHQEKQKKDGEQLKLSNQMLNSYGVMIGMRDKNKDLDHPFLTKPTLEETHFSELIGSCAKGCQDVTTSLIGIYTGYSYALKGDHSRSPSCEKLYEPAQRSKPQLQLTHKPSHLAK